MTPLYRIKRWDQHFENNRTREIKHMTWVPVPNKQDGDGYTALIDHKNGVAHYGAWHAILAIASKCDPRGTLLRDNGRPHTPESLARMSKVPALTLSSTLNRLVSDDIGWVEIVAQDIVDIPPHEGAAISQVPAQDLTRTEQNRTEQNGDALRVSQALAESILSWKSDYRELQPGRRKQTEDRWYQDVEKMLRLDGRSVDSVLAIVKWLPTHSNGTFAWRNNILSGEKLRKQYDKLDMTKAAERPGSVKHNNPTILTGHERLALG